MLFQEEYERVYSQADIWSKSAFVYKTKALFRFHNFNIYVVQIRYVMAWGISAFS